MGYVETSLNASEQIKYIARLSLWGYVTKFILGGGLVVGCTALLLRSFANHPVPDGMRLAYGFFILVGACMIAWPFLARRSTELAITDNRLIAKFGIVSTHSIEIRLDKIEAVRVTQTFIGKFLNFGDILVTGTGTTFDPIPNISRPLVFRSALNEAMENRSAAPLSHGR